MTAPHKDFDKEEGGDLGLDGDLDLGRDHTLGGDVVISGDFVGKTRRSFSEWKWDGDLVPHHCNKIVIFMFICLNHVTETLSIYNTGKEFMLNKKQCPYLLVPSQQQLWPLETILK